jgi:hypothetical protein
MCWQFNYILNCLSVPGLSLSSLSHVVHALPLPFTLFVCCCVWWQLVQLSPKKATLRGPAGLVGIRKRPIGATGAPGLSTETQIEIAQNRRAVINLIKYLIERVNQQYPLMVVLEDANFMDDESWELTAELCKSVAITFFFCFFFFFFLKIVIMKEHCDGNKLCLFFSLLLNRSRLPIIFCIVENVQRRDATRNEKNAPCYASIYDDPKRLIEVTILANQSIIF